MTEIFLPQCLGASQRQKEDLGADRQQYSNQRIFSQLQLLQLPGKKLEEKFAKVIVAKKKTFRKIVKVWKTENKKRTQRKL